MKTIVSVLLAILIQMSSLLGTVSTPVSDDDSVYDDNEIVSVIVELKDDSLLEGVKNSKQRMALLENFENSDAYKKIVNAQEKLKNKISDKIKKADFDKSYSYSFVMNGFSLEVPYKYIKTIKNLPGVSDVQISALYDAPSTVEDEENAEEINTVLPLAQPDAMHDEGELTGVNKAHENGYTGKGTVVAIIDSGFELSHEAFATAPENPRLSKKDINLLTTFGCLNTIIPIYKHYVSEKIPYIWDYSEVNADVKNPNSDHGTHVAGIVGGNSSVLTGVAPDAQLLLMKVFGDKKDSKANEAVYLAALDDAVKLGADACNMSLSSPSGQQPTNIFTSEVIRRLKNAGVAVICSAGNSDASDAAENSTDIFDYGTAGSPSTFDYSMSVASSRIYSRESIYTDTINAKGIGSVNMSSFSAWGPSADLKFKPEIIAPGSDIYSSVPGNTYAYMSGTSMSSPYFTGCYALTKEYISEKYPSLDKKSSTELINSILMSTATAFRGYSMSALFSPRRIGAGFVNLDGAMSTKAYLTTASGARPKLELGEDTDGVLDLTFNIVNMSDEPLQYNLSVSPLTDSYAMRNGKYVNTLTASNIAKSDYSVEYIDGVSETGIVSVDGNSKKTISLRLSFSDSFLEKMRGIFTNGYFLDGFVNLTSKTEPTLSIPYMAFDGDWDKGPLFDNTMYSGKEAYFDTQWGLYVTDGKDYYPLGQNMFESTKSYDIDTKYCAYSKNALASHLKKHYVTACFGLLRNAKRIDYNVFTQSGIYRYSGSTLLDYQRKTVSYYSPERGKLWGFLGGAVTNGQSYVYTVSARAQSYDSGRITMKFPFIVDNNAPKIDSCSYKIVDGKPMLSINVSDNHYVQGFRIYNSDSRRIGDVSFKDIEPVNGSYEYTVDVSSLSKYISFSDLKDIQLYCVDYAYNETWASISLDGDLSDDKIVDIESPVYPTYFNTDSTVVDSEAQLNYGIFDKTIKRLQAYLDTH